MKHNLTANKILAAFLLAVAAAWIANAISTSVVEPQKLEKNAFVVDTSAIATAATATDAAPAGPGDILPMLASANVMLARNMPKSAAPATVSAKVSPPRLGQIFMVLSGQCMPIWLGSPILTA